LLRYFFPSWQDRRADEKIEEKKKGELLKISLSGSPREI
jgi:hypothetical protein